MNKAIVKKKTVSVKEHVFYAFTYPFCTAEQYKTRRGKNLSKAPCFMCGKDIEGSICLAFAEKGTNKIMHLFCADALAENNGMSVHRTDQQVL